MTEKIAEHIGNISPEITTFILAMLPISELRGAIPWGIFALKMEWYKALIWAIIGNLAPIPLILLLLEPIRNSLCRWSIANKFFNWLFARTRRRGRIIEKYRALGLMLFVSIPLPVTGAWTGAAAAFIFGIKFRYALPAIVLGVIVAGIIVTSLCMFGWGFTNIARYAISG